MAASRDHRAELKVGDRIQNRYSVEGELGTGGFATVYSARDRVIDRPVAIKVLKIGLAMGSDADEVKRTRKRFLREARVAARIAHPSIVDIYDFGLLQGSDAPFIVMEYLQGHNLFDEIQDNGPLSPPWLLPKFCDLLDALGEAHDQNIVHKDLKPGNIFLNNPGTRKEVWKVVDFGIAYVDGPASARLTKTGFLSGTPQYLPPEYIQKQEVTPQMDVYQMALTLVEALCGDPVVPDRKPFQAARRHVTGDLVVPEMVIRSPLGRVLMRALALNPEDRYPTGTAFADALAEVDVYSVPTFSKQDENRHKTQKMMKVDGPGEG